MGLYSSFYASLSGLSSTSNSLSIIGNNLSNLNTIGYKSSSGTFQDLFSTAMGASGTQGNGNPMQIGLGSRMGAINQNFGQGSFSSTSSVTDMAISGEGFFMLKTPDGGSVYSRAGNFTINRNGYLVDPNNNQVLGWNRNTTTNTLTPTGVTAPIQINMGTTSPPAATSTISMNTNLNAASTTLTAAQIAAGTTSFTAPIQIYDSLGNSHSLIANYQKTGASTWQVYFTSDDTGATITPGTPATALALTFDSSGAMITPTGAQNIAISGWSDGAANSAISWTPASQVTSYAASSATSNAVQDGFGAGTIRSLIVDQQGVITGNFTNGQTIALAQVALSTFSNPSGLSKVGNNTWTTTLSSGVPNVGQANQGGRGTVLGGNLELSNVDMADEFTKLIIAQRGYQANSRVVTTSDELLQETLNLKR